MKVAIVAFTWSIIILPLSSSRPIVSQIYRNKLRNKIRTIEEGPLYPDGIVPDGSQPRSLGSGDGGSNDNFGGESKLIPITSTNIFQQLEMFAHPDSLDHVEFNDCCQPKFLQFSTSGIYPLQHNKVAFCDMESDGGGWLVIQRRTEIKGNRRQRSFDKTWVQYKRGFGAVDKHSFWLGLDTIHTLTSVPNGTELMIMLKRFNGTKEYVYYKNFHVDNETNLYRASISGYDSAKSTVIDSLFSINGAPFTTMDHDNYKLIMYGQRINCATRHGGGWWYKARYGCSDAFLNLRYISNLGIPYANNNIGGYDFFVATEMKIRPKAWYCGLYGKYDPVIIQHHFVLRHHPAYLNQGNEALSTTQTPAITEEEMGDRKET